MIITQHAHDAGRHTTSTCRRSSNVNGCRCGDASSSKRVRLMQPNMSDNAPYETERLRQAMVIGLLRFLCLRDVVTVLNTCRCLRQDTMVGAMAVAQTRAGRHFFRGCYEDWFQTAPECIVRENGLLYGRCRRIEHYKNAVPHGEVRFKHSFLLPFQQAQAPSFETDTILGHGNPAQYTQLVSLVGMLEKYVVRRAMREFDGSSTFVIQPLIVPLWKYGSPSPFKRSDSTPVNDDDEEKPEVPNPLAYEWTQDDVQRALNAMYKGFGDLFFQEADSDDEKEDDEQHPHEVAQAVEGFRDRNLQERESVSSAESSVSTTTVNPADDIKPEEGASDGNSSQLSSSQQTAATSSDARRSDGTSDPSNSVAGAQFRRPAQPPCSHASCRSAYLMYRWHVQHHEYSDDEYDDELDDEEDEEDDEDEEMEVDSRYGDDDVVYGSDTEDTMESKATSSAQSQTNPVTQERQELEDDDEWRRRRYAYCATRLYFPVDVCLETIKAKQREYLFGLLEPFFNDQFQFTKKTKAIWLQKDTYACDGTFHQSESPTLIAGISSSGYLCGVLITVTE